ncbi:hypothetical protein AAHN97_06395 [Chitinophaga niabensis]|uniref:hypothetical protein n=1 Tax=Chitinophaga niabensis TaxID=536979 RepID=UPI0031BB4236
MLILLLLALLNPFKLDQPKWSELTSFEIHTIVEIDQFHKMNDVDIQKLPSKMADLNEAKKILSTAKVKSIPILWKGTARVAVAKFKDGSRRTILINTYGHSFRDVTGKVDYTFEENGDAWTSFIKSNRP